jgi:hypothetical protein
MDRGEIRAEADLIERFARSYRRKFAQVIDQLNHEPAKLSDMQCIRLCVEAVDMVLATQTELARALREMDEKASRKAA